jgi:Domain of unknown function (DUF4288)
MKWYLAKIIFRIINGKENRPAQFEEQLRLIEAENEIVAFHKAQNIGKKEQETFYNMQQEPVQWKFINVPQLYQLNELSDGTEIYSSIYEKEDAENYLNITHLRAEHLLEDSVQKTVQLN